MARYILSIFSCVLLLSYQVKSQIIRSPLNLFNHPYSETIIEAPRNYIEAPCTYADIPRNYIEAPRAYTDASRNYIEAPRAYTDASRNYVDVPIEARNYINSARLADVPRNYVQSQPNIIAESPCNGMVPVASMSPPTTIIADCTPSVCKNLADTINLMVVSNLLQNTKGGDQATMQFAGPLLQDLLSNAGVVAGFSNPISNLVSPNLIAPNSFAPNGYSPNLATSNVITPNLLPQNVIAPNLIASNVYGPNSVAPRVVGSSVSPVNGVVSPNASINNSAMISSLLQLLGSSM